MVMMKTMLGMWVLPMLIGGECGDHLHIALLVHAR